MCVCEMRDACRTVEVNDTTESENIYIYGDNSISFFSKILIDI